MFIVKGLKTGKKCLACERETECYEVECAKQGVSGFLCPQDFRKQVKIATAISTASAERDSQLMS